MALLDPQGGHPAAHEQVIELREREQTFRFPDVDRPPVLSINRGFSAPVIVNADDSRETLIFLLAHDTDPFNRWDAGQKLAIGVLLELVAAQRSATPMTIDDEVLDAFGRVLDDTDLDPALIAQALTLPSESYLADQCEQVDVDAIHAAREQMRKALAGRLSDRFMAHYLACRDEGGYRFDAAHMARRSLRNLCLAYLMESGHAEALGTCTGQFQRADNMSDSLAALSILAQFDVPQRREALDDFYARWRQDPLVVNKWFSIQAGSRLPDTLSQVKALMEHEAFSITNPNNVRAVVGRFCQGNAVRFHDASGAGYRFLTEQVMTLDPMNPQVAARLASAFSRWHRYDPQRQALMRAELERLSQVEKLSTDVYEIVSKSLEG
jgi:aminopeptidase N